MAAVAASSCGLERERLRPRDLGEYAIWVSTSLAIQLTGSLRVRPMTGCTIDGSSSTGASFSFALRPINRSAALDGGSARATIDSPAVFVAQPWTNGLRATVFYLHVLTEAALTLRLTLEVSGAITIPCQGMFAMEFPSTDRVTGLEIMGTGAFEWQVSGAQV